MRSFLTLLTLVGGLAVAAVTGGAAHAGAPPNKCPEQPPLKSRDPRSARSASRSIAFSRPEHGAPST